MMYPKCDQYSLQDRVNMIGKLCKREIDLYEINGLFKVDLRELTDVEFLGEYHYIKHLLTEGVNRDEYLN